MKHFLRRHLFIVVLTVLFLLLNSWAIFSWYTYQLNPDGLSYITIAEKYAHGDFKHAINGYWGPMMSWLLVPFVWVGANLIISFKLVTLVTAAAILGITYWTLLRYKISKAITYPLCLILAAWLTEWGVYNPLTPDMVLGLWTLLLGLGLNEFIKNPSRKLGISIGVIGALMYYTKGFGFFLFLATIAAVAAWQWWFEDKREHRVVIKRYLAMGAVFFALTLPFVGVISLKYHKLTVNNAGTFNWNVYGVHGGGTQPIDNFGPYEPPNATAVSAWEDPTRLSSKDANWGVLDSRVTLEYFLKKIVWVNFNAIFSIMRGYGGFVSFAYVVLIIGVLGKRLYRREYAVFALINGLMFVGYSLIFIDGRYIWGGAVLAMIGVAFFASTLEAKKVLTSLQIAVGGLVVAAVSFLVIVQAVVGNRDTGADLFALSQDIKSSIPSGAHVMSDRFAPAFPICYHLDLKCYNVMDPPLDKQDDYYRLIKSYGVTYYLDFGLRPEDEKLKTFIDRYASYQQSYEAKGTKLKLYKIN